MRKVMEGGNSHKQLELFDKKVFHHILFFFWVVVVETVSYI